MRAVALLIWLVFSPCIFALDQSSPINLRCEIQKQHVCSIDGCNKITPSVTILIEPAGNHEIHYSRCDSRGCDKYRSSISQPGSYIEISPLNKNSQLKIYTEDMTFMEVAGLGLSTYIGFGKCEETKK